MLNNRQPVLRRFWYPVMPVAMLDRGSQPFTLLGERLVLGRPAQLAGEPRRHVGPRLQHAPEPVQVVGGQPVLDHARAGRVRRRRRRGQLQAALRAELGARRVEVLAVAADAAQVLQVGAGHRRLASTMLMSPVLWLIWNARRTRSYHCGVASGSISGWSM